jgi:excisionase family DNA binding protein
MAMKNISEIEEIFITILTPLIKKSVNNAISGLKLPEQKKEKDKLISVKEAAEFLQLAVPTVYSMTSTHKIPFRKRGKKLYFRQSELEAWLEAGKKKSKAELDEEAEEHIIKKGGRNV